MDAFAIGKILSIKFILKTEVRIQNPGFRMFLINNLYWIELSKKVPPKGDVFYRSNIDTTPSLEGFWLLASDSRILTAPFKFKVKDSTK